jgi:hypothetical protein
MADVFSLLTPSKARRSTAADATAAAATTPRPSRTPQQQQQQQQANLAVADSALLGSPVPTAAAAGTAGASEELSSAIKDITAVFSPRSSSARKAGRPGPAGGQTPRKPRALRF